MQLAIKKEHFVHVISFIKKIKDNEEFQNLYIFTLFGDLHMAVLNGHAMVIYKITRGFVENDVYMVFRNLTELALIAKGKAIFLDTDSKTIFTSKDEYTTSAIPDESSVYDIRKTVTDIKNTLHDSFRYGSLMESDNMRLSINDYEPAIISKSTLFEVFRMSNRKEGYQYVITNVPDYMGIVMPQKMNNDVKESIKQIYAFF